MFKKIKDEKNIIIASSIVLGVYLAGIIIDILSLDQTLVNVLIYISSILMLLIYSLIKNDNNITIKFKLITYGICISLISYGLAITGFKDMTLFCQGDDINQNLCNISTIGLVGLNAFILFCIEAIDWESLKER